MHVWHMRRNRVSDGAIHRAFPRRRRLLLPRHYMCHMRTIHVSYEEEDACVRGAGTLVDTKQELKRS